MKVICIKTEFYVDGPFKGKVSILYGTVYTVINVIDEKSLTMINPPHPNVVGFLVIGINWRVFLDFIMNRIL